MNLKRNIAAIVTAASMALSGCATTGSGEPRTVEQKIAACVGIVLAGAALGAIIGNNTGSGDAQRGAGRGALVGVGVCAIWWAFNNQRDRERIAQMQMAAASTGQPQSQRWIDPEGRERQVFVAPSTATEMLVPNNGAPERRLCRQLNTTASVAGASDAMSETTCRNPDGSWASTPDATFIPKV